MSILIKNVGIDRAKTDILIKDNTINKIGPHLNDKAEITIDGENKAALPGFINGHTHAAMTLFRSYADDLPLQIWLEKNIWPLEAKLTEEDVYRGTKLACLEMIKSGTTFFNDMYWYMMGAAKAVEEMGIRAALSTVFLDFNDPKEAQKRIKLNNKLFNQREKLNKRITFALGPHSIYTVSKESLKRIKSFSDTHNLLIHFHASETEKEVQNCIEKHGKRPIEYLEDIGFLGTNLILCHAIRLDEKEIEICAKYNVKIVYNPVSNLKLCSGIQFPYQKFIAKGIQPILGTDGCASNNNLDLLESAKFASIIQKSIQNNPTALPADEAIKMLTSYGAKTFGLNAGEIKEGMLADIILIDLDKSELAPNHNLNANLIYSTNGSCVHTLICDGKILMQDRKVKGEEEIIEKVSKVAYEITKR